MWHRVDSLYLDYPLSQTKCSVHWNFTQEHCIAFLYLELLYLKLFPIWNKFSSPLNHFLSLSQTFIYSNFIFEFPNKFKFESKQKFRRQMKKNLFFVLSVVKTKMSVKLKLNRETLKDKCDILSHIEKGKPINLVYVKTPFQLGLKTKKKICKCLKKVLQALRIYVVVNMKKSTRLCLNGLFYRGARTYL